MKRRSFLHGVAAAGVLSGLSSSWSALFFNSRRSFAHPDLLLFFKDPQTILDIGSAYLSHYPEHRDRPTLSDRIAKRLGPTKVGGIKEALAQTLREDFAAGDTLQLNGWIVSRTEAQQCALYFITNG